MYDETVVSYSQYYDQGNFVANRRWRRNLEPVGQYIKPIPQRIIERSEIIRPFRSSGLSAEFGHFEYFEAGVDVGLGSGIFVARNPEYPLALVVGPFPFIERYMHGVFLLDKLYPNNCFHHMDVVASVEVGKGNTVSRRKLWNDYLLSKMFIKHECVDQKTNSELNPTVGITSKITDWPVFFMYADMRMDVKTARFSPIEMASAVVHDFTHVIQEELGYPSVSLPAERQAISNQLRFLEAIFCNQSFFLNKKTFYDWLPESTMNGFNEYFERSLFYLTSIKAGGTGHLTFTPGKAPDIAQRYLQKNIDKFLPIKDFR